MPKRMNREMAIGFTLIELLVVISIICFVDFTVRAIGLKEMWRFKWHRVFDIHAESPVWPQ
jgi:prepilin-type N-terminal cleavage/methylation domain-containing protein